MSMKIVVKNLNFDNDHELYKVELETNFNSCYLKGKRFRHDNIVYEVQNVITRLNDCETKRINHEQSYLMNLWVSKVRYGWFYKLFIKQNLLQNCFCITKKAIDTIFK